MTRINLDRDRKNQYTEYGRILAHPPPSEAVVISGISGVFPKCRNVEELRDSLMNKLDLTTAHYREGFDHAELPKRSGTLNTGLQDFDAGFFGMHENQADPCSIETRILLEKSIEAIIDAGMNPKDIESTKTGFYLGYCYSDTESTLGWKTHKEKRFPILTAARFSMVSRVAYFLKLKGPTYQCDSACSSSLHALDHAFKDIRSGECENAIVAGANLSMFPGTTLQFAKLGVLSPRGICQPFDKNGDGYVRSEVITVVLLQKARNSKRIYAQVINTKCNSDGFKDNGITFPSRAAQAELIAEVLEESNVQPDNVTYLEGHATGTSAGDPEECAAIDSVIGQNRKTPLRVGSVKSNMGHSEPSAGICSIVKCLISMESGFLFPTINYSETRPGISSILEGRLEVVTEPIKITEEHPLMAVNSFGFGGSNSLSLIRSISKKKQNGGEPSDNLPRLVMVSGRNLEAVNSLLDSVPSNPLDAEYIRLLQNSFRIDIPNNSFKGYMIISKTTEISRSFDKISLERLPLYFVFGDLRDWYALLQQFSAVPVFAGSLQNIQGYLKKKDVDVKTTILSADEEVRKSYNTLGSLVIQICLADVLKKLNLRPVSAIGYSFGELVCAYYDDDLDLETVLGLCLILNGEAIFNGEKKNGLIFGSSSTNEKTLKIRKDIVTKFSEELKNKQTVKRSEAFVDAILRLNITSTHDIIHSDSLIVEIGENELMNYDSEKTPWELKSLSFHSFIEFLQILGSLYILGYNASIENLYPTIEFPVSKSTPNISSKIKWNHERKWFIHSQMVLNAKKYAPRHFEIDLKNKQWSFVAGHLIDGRLLFPASGYLYLAWQTLLGKFPKLMLEYTVTFRNCRFIRATNVPLDGSVALDVTIQPSGHFEVLEGESIVVAGEITIEQREKAIERLPVIPSDSNMMNSKDIYKELRLRGYNYNGEFQAIREVNLDATLAHITWNDNWITFIDNMFQMKILKSDSRLLYVPTFIAKITIANKYHERFVAGLLGEKSGVLPVHYYPEVDTIRCGGIEVHDLKASSIPRKKVTATPVLETYQFLPNYTELSTADSVRVNAQIILENTLLRKIKSLEIIEDETLPEDYQVLSTILIDCLGDQPMIQPEAAIQTTAELNVDVTVINKKLVPEDEYTLIIATNISKNVKLLGEASNALRENGFLICRESPDFENMPQSIGLSVITVHRNPKETLVLLNKLSKKKKTVFVDFTEDPQFDWLPKIQDKIKWAIKNKEEIIIQSTKNSKSGLLGFVNCLRREPEGGIVKCVLVLDETEDFDPNVKLFADQLKKGLAINVYQNGSWGTYRHLLLKKPEVVKSDHCFVAQTVRGDLSSLTWFEGSLNRDMLKEPEKRIIKIHYSSLNFRDIMTASGKINVDAITTNRLEQECGQGFEFSGIDQSGQRVMGIIPHGALSTLAYADNHLLWRVPDEWSLAEAASVPVVYGTTVYALAIRGGMKRGDSILIHSGTGGVGQAAIRYALYHGCTVFTTVGNQAKRDFLKQLYPQLTDKNIGTSRDQSFVKMVMKRTKGRGVDIVLNSLAEDKLLASARCLGKGGRFLEIGKYDLFANSPLSLLLLEKEASFHGIVLDALFNSQPSEKLTIYKLLGEGIRSGSIKPLGTTVFKTNEIEQAFRHMTRGIHMGKVLVEVQKEEKIETKKPDIRGIPRYNCHADKCYIIVGGLGGLGLELTDWLILRGARKIVLTSRGGIRTGYQRSRIRLWRSYGVLVAISTSDVTTNDGCKELIEEANKLGPICAIFNLAAVLQDAAFENQNRKMYEISLAPKAYATKCLDEVSRSLCPELSDFVVFSSVSCGRGNPGQTNYGMANSVMERICEQRRRDGYPALAIQWGAVGEVGLVAEMQELHSELEISGTLPQRISSCMEVMDIALRQKSATIVSSMVVAEKRSSANSASLSGTVLDIIGIKDIKSVSIQSTLAELGMDSMTGVEIRQVLEREFDVFLSAKELRTLTVARLMKLEEEKQNQMTENKHNFSLKEIMSLLPTDNKGKAVILELESRISDTEGAPLVFLIGGIEGYSEALRTLTRQLNARTISFQYDYDNPLDNIVKMAALYTSYIEDNITKDQPFCIVAYSYGICAGLEVVSVLESKGYKGTLVSIDGSPSVLQTLASLISHENVKIFEVSIIRETTNSYVENDVISKYIPELMEIESLDERLERTADIVKEYLPYEKEFIKSLYKGLIKRMWALKMYTPTFTKINSKVILFKPTEQILKEYLYDLGLSLTCGNPVEVIEIEGNHLSILGDENLANRINSLL
uniref:Fatty acid synthase 1 n=1 Tax=Colaphellus bowringi TaxID=561076 RepID=A0A172GY34_9CUCU|nr:fatty acid synthase 1 [Colaphellus bowringi]